MTKFGVGILADVTSNFVTSNTGVFRSMVYAFGFGCRDASLSPESMSITCMAMLLIYLEIKNKLKGRRTSRTKKDADDMYRRRVSNSRKFW